MNRKHIREPEERTLRHLTTRRVLVVLLGVLSALALVLFGKWLNATKRGGQGPAEPFRIAGNLYYVGANDVAASRRAPSPGSASIAATRGRSSAWLFRVAVLATC